jgi:predicted  nucleic acid-binding Zn-ribbon protein
MIKINALALLFIIQLLIVFIVLNIDLFRRIKKLKSQAVKFQGEIMKLRLEIENLGNIHNEIEERKEAFIALQSKFEGVRKAGSSLKESIEKLVPNAERSDEYEKIISDIESNNKELDRCISRLQKENEGLRERSEAVHKNINKLSAKLNNSVSRKEYDNVMAEKRTLERVASKLKDEIADITKQYEGLEKNYLWLEKEYNALYTNVTEAQ